MSCNVLVEDALGGLEGSVSWDENVWCDASSLPGRPSSSVRVDGGDTEEDASLGNLEGLGWVGAPRGGLSNNHGTAKLLHDINKLLRGTSGGSTGQDDEAFLGAVPFA